MIPPPCSIVGIHACTVGVSNAPKTDTLVRVSNATMPHVCRLYPLRCRQAVIEGSWGSSRRRVCLQI